jgi:hypothetical protein
MLAQAIRHYAELVFLQMTGLLNKLTITAIQCLFFNAGHRDLHDKKLPEKITRPTDSVIFSEFTSTKKSSRVIISENSIL